MKKMFLIALAVLGGLAHAELPNMHSAYANCSAYCSSFSENYYDLNLLGGLSSLFNSSTACFSILGTAYNRHKCMLPQGADSTVVTSSTGTIASSSGPDVASGTVFHRSHKQFLSELNLGPAVEFDTYSLKRGKDCQGYAQTLYNATYTASSSDSHYYCIVCTCSKESHCGPATMETPSASR